MCVADPERATVVPAFFSRALSVTGVCSECSTMLALLPPPPGVYPGSYVGCASNVGDISWQLTQQTCATPAHGSWRSSQVGCLRPGPSTDGALWRIHGWGWPPAIWWRQQRACCVLVHLLHWCIPAPPPLSLSLSPPSFLLVAWGVHTCLPLCSPPPPLLPGPSDLRQRVEGLSKAVCLHINTPARQRDLCALSRAPPPPPSTHPHDLKACPITLLHPLYGYIHFDHPNHSLSFCPPPLLSYPILYSATLRCAGRNRRYSHRGAAI
jgi:hypothetical protein